MRDKRRRIFYVDKIFQKRVLLFFLGWNVVIVLSNSIFYILYLKNLVEDNLYRSHIRISSLAEVFSDAIIRFNLILAGASIIAVVIFYLFVRLRIKAFFAGIKRSIRSRIDRGDEEDAQAVSFSEEFADIDVVLQEFFKDVDEKTKQEQKRLSKLKDVLSKL